MEYNIYGKISFDVDFIIDADTEEDAIEKAKELLEDYYRLDVENAEHDKESVKININADEIS